MCVLSEFSEVFSNYALETGEHARISINIAYINDVIRDFAHVHGPSSQQECLPVLCHASSTGIHQLMLGTLTL